MSNAAVNRTVASCYENCSTNIPLPKSIVRTFSNDKWREKYEESEKKRKTLLGQHEKTIRDYEELKKKYKQLELINTVSESELGEKKEQLRKLKTVSQNLYKEYDILQNQYDVETSAMHRALSEATQWYKQNRELKRQSALLTGVAIFDTTDGDGEDLEGLRETIKELSASNARLLAELNETKQAEFEATEQVVNLTQELETLRDQHESLKSELRDLKTSNEQMMRVSKIMTEELAEMRESEKKHKENVVSLRCEANDAIKERNVLKHQSALLMQGFTLENDKLMLLGEIEGLKRSLEETTNKYELEIQQLHEKIDEHESNMQVEILEERLKLAESELRVALEQLEKKEKEVVVTVPPPPLPPPPPPLPNVSLSTMVSARRKPDLNDNASPPESLTQNNNNNNKKSVPQPGIDDIINQIKGGKFTLKTTNKPPKKEREEPKAVSEMLQILGALKRSPRPRISMNVSLQDLKV